MKLDLSQIRAVTTGAAQIRQENGLIRFNRFNEAQHRLYQDRDPNLNMKTRSTAGIKLHFDTDSENLFLSITAQQGSSRSYFAIDVLVDGKWIGSLNNYSQQELPTAYTTVELPLGEYSHSFSLGKGKKRVCIYFPWSVNALLRELRLDDGAQLIPVKAKHTLLAFGDSITQGYDALHPANTYLARLARHLDADEHNKAVGGELFFPALAAAQEEIAPDWIVVAYGTNDWSTVTREQLESSCREFFENLRRRYPGVKTLAITPIWRADAHTPTACGSFEVVEEIIRESAKDMPQVRVIPGAELVPHREVLFADLYLHPNDEGFAYYFENLPL